MAGDVRFEGVWKRFRRGVAHDSLRDLIPSLVKRLRPGRRRKAPELGKDEFWAVRNVSFKVEPGQALGIIGANGAGKSTALKLLTRILTPTRGRALVDGRVGALIEVSAGFHLDLTGRENIYLQGAIMGMPLKLIRARFDDIVEFSGVGTFIDMPVKRYSSGMNARLGFSIAAHLEPDVLIIDEVLSVGDAEFQRRAFDRIRQMVQSNIPVVIVSHQLDRIVELCTECILLRHGEVAYQGKPSAAVQAYLAGSRSEATSVPGASLAVAGAVFTRLGPVTPSPVESGSLCTFEVAGELATATLREGLKLDLVVFDMLNQRRVYWTALRELGIRPTGPGPFQHTVQFRANLPEGLYRLETAIWNEPEERLVGEGPSQLFQVFNTSGSFGSHQLCFSRL